MKNVVVAKPQEVVLPTDMDGISVYNYLLNEDLNITAGCICSEVITSFEERKKEVKAIDWNDYCYNIHRLVEMLYEPLYCGGFEFDIVVGINRGGLFTADLISREYGHNMPVMVLFADRRNKSGKSDSEDTVINNMDIIQILGEIHSLSYPKG